MNTSDDKPVLSVPMDEVAGADVNLDAVAARYSRTMTDTDLRRFVERQRAERAMWKVRQRSKKGKEE